MAHIMSELECMAKHNCQDPSNKCPFPQCPTDKDCLNCKTHCPCCMGCEAELCNQCSEKDCDNRTAEFDPNSVQKEE